MTSLPLLLSLAASLSAADTLVVCPQEFREALAPWVELRTRQGHELTMLSNEHAPEVLRAAIKQGAAAGARYVLLVGDAEPRATRDATLRARCVPAAHIAAKVNIRWGSSPEIGTDNWYADVDEDGAPDVAIGRLTADSPDELRVMVKKIIDYEQSAEMGAWRRRIHFVAGIGGFGAIADAAIENGAKQFITEGIPAAYDVSMTYGSWRSVYCPPPSQFLAATLNRLNDGCLFWVYLGHGSPRSLAPIKTPAGYFPVLSAREAPQIDCRSGLPIALMLTCHAGAYDLDQDCLAEEMLRRPGGPVAVIGGSRVTMPYASGVLATEAMDECFLRGQKTLGDMFLAAKRTSLLGPRTDLRSRVLDAIGWLLSEKGARLEDERREHAALFNLLGDPLLQIPLPEKIAVEAAAKVTAGTELAVSGMCSEDGTCTVELVVRRDRLTFEPKSRGSFSSAPAAEAEYLATWQRANTRQLFTAQVTVKDGRFQCHVPVPAVAEGACHVCVHMGGKNYCLGSADVFVERVKEKE